ncbi:MAG: thioesterase [Deltaproteobacteria bacterium]|nr:thioesterase [Deltaproteobacteria bacterium]
MIQEHYDKLIRMYAKAPINKFYNPQMTIENGTAKISISITPNMLHSANGVHGSVYFKLLDDAAFFAANSIETNFFVLTSDFHIRLLRPVTRGTLIATGWVSHAGRKNILAHAELKDEQGKLISTGQGSFARSSMSLHPECGYE